MFWIGFTDEPLIEAEAGELGRVGLLVLGNQEERFVVHLSAWSEHQYVEHWARSLNRAIAAGTSALITDMQTPSQSSHLVWWPVWRINDELVFHNQLLFFAQHEISGPEVDIDRLYRLIGELTPYNRGGTPVSEWRVSVSDVQKFLAGA